MMVRLVATSLRCVSTSPAVTVVEGATRIIRPWFQALAVSAIRRPPPQHHRTFRADTAAVLAYVLECSVDLRINPSPVEAQCLPLANIPPVDSPSATNQNMIAE